MNSKSLDWDRMTVSGARSLLKVLEGTPLFNRDSGDNETIIKLRSFIEDDVRN